MSDDEADVVAIRKGTAMSHTMTAGGVVQGVVVEKGDGVVVLGLPGTEYRLHLRAEGVGVLERLPAAGSDKPVTGKVRARAMRVDVVRVGGAYVEPVYGRPRRVQGRVTAVDVVGKTITVRCAPGCEMVCELKEGQRAADFSKGQLVSFDVEPGATFEPM